MLSPTGMGGKSILSLTGVGGDIIALAARPTFTEQKALFGRASKAQMSLIYRAHKSDDLKLFSAVITSQDLFIDTNRYKIWLVKIS